MNFNIPLSGIKAIGQQLNAISDNIANGETGGFKAGRTAFSASVSGDHVSGVEVGPRSQSISTAGRMAKTGRKMDGAIDGRGFFIVKGSDGIAIYTRHGEFKKDVDGLITDKHGRRTQGWSADGSFGDIKIDSADMLASATTALNFAANLSNNWAPRVAARGWSVHRRFSSTET